MLTRDFRSVSGDTYFETRYQPDTMTLDTKQQIPHKLRYRILAEPNKKLERKMKLSTDTPDIKQLDNEISDTYKTGY